MNDYLIGIGKKRIKDVEKQQKNHSQLLAMPGWNGLISKLKEEGTIPSTCLIKILLMPWS
jgi:hypothetical protein